MTFGDSNTHGTPPMLERGPYYRFGVGTRWPTVAHQALGADWTLIEEGLPGRTATSTPDPEMGPSMDGQLGLRIALQSHGPIDVLTIMLGTNDIKAHFGMTAEGVAGQIAGLLAIANSLDMQARHGGFKTLVICPPGVLEQGPIKDVFYGASAKARALPAALRGVAAHWGVGFLDAGQHIGPSQTDGVHFEPDAHKILGATVAKAITAL